MLGDFVRSVELFAKTINSHQMYYVQTFTCACGHACAHTWAAPGLNWLRFESLREKERE